MRLPRKRGPNDDERTGETGGMLRVCVQCEVAPCRGSIRRHRNGNGCEGGGTTAAMDLQGSWPTLEKNDAVQQFGAAPPVLMLLASEKGWPYSWNTMQDPPKDVFVNCELERVWQIVKGDLTAWFSPHGGTDFKPKRRVLIGTPGIGKSVAVGSYLSTSCCTTISRNSKW
ncbi:putative retrotransposon hot spot protein (RHS) [Trypanosoma cruzi]|uniref:Putative retrotransposon hot spot protein (RHS) n=1 Tax=Trypanosoma cruzi TaxID=5693 RepID=A0A2V2W969_TRYCR|nr:putative retrotransposon hot spot protein (RHS) [Trypanosoma cruzi]